MQLKSMLLKSQVYRLAGFFFLSLFILRERERERESEKGACKHGKSRERGKENPREALHCQCRS